MVNNAGGLSPRDAKWWSNCSVPVFIIFNMTIYTNLLNNTGHVALSNNSCIKPYSSCVCSSPFRFLILSTGQRYYWGGGEGRGEITYAHAYTYTHTGKLSLFEALSKKRTGGPRALTRERTSSPPGTIAEVCDPVLIHSLAFMVSNVR